MRIDSFNDVDIKVYVDILHSSKSLSDESLKASLYKPSATLVEHEIAYYGRDAKGQFLIMNILGSEIDEIGEWDLVLTANDGSLFQSQKTLEAFEVVPNGQGDTLEPTCCDSRNCGMVTLYVLMGQRANPCPQPCPCPTPTPEPPVPPTPDPTPDPKPTPYSLERLGSFLYKATFQAYGPYDPSIEAVAPSGCSSFVRDGKLHRNFDWNYTKSPEFLTVCKGFTGISLLPGLSDSGILPVKLIGQAPYHLVDGVNDAGIKVSTHVLYNDFDIPYSTAGESKYDSTLFVHDLLTHVDSMASLASWINSLGSLQFPSVLSKQNYVTQWFITDGTTTKLYTPDAETHSYTLVDISDRPQLTNFKWVDAETLERDAESLQLHPTGVERWNLISGGASLQNLAFTEAYKSTNRLSEFIGLRNTDKTATDEELTEIQLAASALYYRGVRDGATWQTMHSVIYAGNHIESLYVQEDYTHDYIAQGGAGGGIPDAPSDNYEYVRKNGSWVRNSGGGSGVDIDTEFPASPSDTHVPSTKLVNTTFNTFADALGDKLDAATAETTYAKKTEIPTVPTQVSAFTNDAGYLTQHQSLAAYETSEHASATYETKAHAEATYLTEHQPLKTINSQSLIGTGNIEIGGGGSSVTIDTTFPASPSDANVPSTKLVKNSLDAKADASSVPTKTSDLTNDSGFITSSDVPTKTSDLTNDSGFITAAGVPQEVKHAVYGTTTYAEIDAWWQAGHPVICTRTAGAYNAIYWLQSSLNDGSYRFVSSIGDANVYTISVSTSSRWSNSIYAVFRQQYVVKSTDSTASSDANVYSALAADTKFAAKSNYTELYVEFEDSTTATYKLITDND